LKNLCYSVESKPKTWQISLFQGVLYGKMSNKSEMVWWMALVQLTWNDPVTRDVVMCLKTEF